MRIIGIIPARYAATRLPGKPLAPIAGAPMIRHVYEGARRSRAIERLIVATDDARIAEAVASFGGEAVMTSPEHPSGTDRIAEAARSLKLRDSDIVLNIQGDEPLVRPEMLEALCEAAEATDHMATIAFRTENPEDYRNPAVVKVVVDDTMRALYFSRSPIPHHRENPDAPGAPFWKHLGFYAYRQGFLQHITTLPPGRLETLEKLEQLRVLEAGFPILVAPSPHDSVGIDTPEDLERIRRIMGG